MEVLSTGSEYNGKSRGSRPGKQSLLPKMAEDIAGAAIGDWHKSLPLPSATSVDKNRPVSGLTT
jgi:hypothetical protein